MTIERPMFPPRAGKPALRLVGGIESTPPETESRPAPRKPKERGPYKQQARKKYQDGLPVIAPAGEEDKIFRHIAENGRWARCVVITRPTTRRGLIHQARYLASQFNDPVGCKGGCMYLLDDISERPWPMAFLQSLAAGLRKMAGELDPSDQGVTAMSNIVEFPGREPPPEGYSEEYVDKLPRKHFAISKATSAIVCTWRVSQCRWPSTRSRAETTSTKRQCSRRSRSRLC